MGGGGGEREKNKIERREADPRGAVRDRQRSHCSKSIKEEKKSGGRRRGRTRRGGVGTDTPGCSSCSPHSDYFLAFPPPQKNLPLIPRLGHIKKSPPEPPPANSHRGLEGGGGTIGAPPSRCAGVGCGVRGTPGALLLFGGEGGQGKRGGVITR